MGLGVCYWGVPIVKTMGVSESVIYKNIFTYLLSVVILESGTSVLPTWKGTKGTKVYMK